jgi:CRP-like cAMP-binding protein
VSKLARIEKVVVLQSSDLFAFCKAEEVLRIAAIARERHFAAGERIYETNDPADTLYCIVHGSVRLDSAQGGVRIAGPLNCFGMVEILSGRLRAGGAIAEADTLALAIDAEDFFDLLSRNVEIVRALFRQLLPARVDDSASKQHGSVPSESKRTVP